MISGRIHFVPSGAKWSSVTSVADTPGANTDLKRNLSNTEYSFRNRIQLQDVNVLLVPKWRNGPLRIQPHI